MADDHPRSGLINMLRSTAARLELAHTKEQYADTLVGLRHVSESVEKLAEVKPKHDEARPTRASDPRVVEILTVFDSFMASTTRDEGFLDIFMNELLDTGSDASLFSGWDDAAARAVVVAYVLHCPEVRLDEAAEHASNRKAWLAGWELTHAYEDLVGKEGALDGVCHAALGFVLAGSRAVGAVQS